MELSSKLLTVYQYHASYLTESAMMLMERICDKMETGQNGGISTVFNNEPCTARRKIPTDQICVCLMPRKRGQQDIYKLKWSISIPYGHSYVFTD